MDTVTEARNATLEDLHALLLTQQADKVDVVVPATYIRSEGAVLSIKDLRVEDIRINEAGEPEPKMGPGLIRPTAIMDGQMAEKLGIPVKYLRKMREERPDLYDANVNGWLHGGFDWTGDYPEDERKFLLRTFLGEPGETGIGRAMLSDTYAPIENLDVLMAALEGIAASGVECNIVRCNLSENRMSVRFAAPGIAALAPVLMGGYKSPVEGLTDVPQWYKTLESLTKHYSPDHLGWDGNKGETPPIGFAGFEIRNSETGGGAFEVCPVLTFAACKNGLVIEALKVRKVHLGAKLDEGQIEWSHETRQALADLVKLQTTDAVATFLSEKFLTEQIAKVEALAGVELEKPAETIEFVSKKLGYTEEQQEGILAHFIKGGQVTAGGVLNAVTSFAQTVESVDVAAELEASALEALALAAA